MSYEEKQKVIEENRKISASLITINENDIEDTNTLVLDRATQCHVFATKDHLTLLEEYHDIYGIGNNKCRMQKAYLKTFDYGYYSHKDKETLISQSCLINYGWEVKYEDNTHQYIITKNGNAYTFELSHNKF